jgi:4-hydroxy-tetrahydrodipicolinate reductase
MTDPLTVAIGGVGGQMGAAVAALAADRHAVDPVLGFSTTPETVDAPVGEVVDIAVMPDALQRTPVDVLVEFTTAGAVSSFADAAARSGVALVSGTTALTAADHRGLDAAAETVPVLHAANFSRGIAVLRTLVREAVRQLPGADIELTETHHRLKEDAPSGTAETLLADIAAAGGPERRVDGRRGASPRAAAEVGVHARRAGAIAGVHEVLFATETEELTLQHRARSRSVFAAGALDAAEWLAERPPGSYTFDAVLAGAREDEV